MNRIKELRKKKGLTQIQLANIMHVSQGTISAYEAGTVQIDQETLKALADYFGVSIDYLLGYENATTPPEALTVEDYAASGAAVRVTPRPQPQPQPQPSASLDAIIDQLNRLRESAAPLKTDEQNLVEMYRKLPKEAQAAITRFAQSFIKDGDL